MLATSSAATKVKPKRINLTFFQQELFESVTGFAWAKEPQSLRSWASLANASTKSWPAQRSQSLERLQLTLTCITAWNACVEAKSTPSCPDLPSNLPRIAFSSSWADATVTWVSPKSNLRWKKTLEKMRRLPKVFNLLLHDHYVHSVQSSTNCAPLLENLIHWRKLLRNWRWQLIPLFVSRQGSETSRAYTWQHSIASLSVRNLLLSDGLSMFKQMQTLPPLITGNRDSDCAHASATVCVCVWLAFSFSIPKLQRQRITNTWRLHSKCNTLTLPASAATKKNSIVDAMLLA